MTDNDIKQALECCGDETGLHWCTDCPYYNKENDLCQEDLNRDSLDLINRQQAEIDKWKAEYTRACAERDARICTQDYFKSEAIKEFEEKVVNKLDAMHDMVNLNQKVVVTDAIITVKQIAKEMAGEQNA